MKYASIGHVLLALQSWKEESPYDKFLLEDDFLKYYSWNIVTDLVWAVKKELTLKLPWLEFSNSPASRTLSTKSQKLAILANYAVMPKLF